MKSLDTIKIIYLYRHGETNFNVNGVTMGQLEGIKTEFTQVGYEEIRNISNSLKENKIEVIYSSDFNRTMDTAKLANTNNQLPIIISKKARGLNMGKYQGLEFQKFINSEEVKRSFENYNIPFPEGESINELNNRLYTFINEICNQTSYERIAIITHSAAISNLKAFVSNDKYISLKMCCLMYKDNKLNVIDYIPVNEKIKNKQKSCKVVKKMELYNNLILIRHAENIIDENLSNSLLSLSDRGVLQAKQAAELLKEKFDIVISSPSKRAIMTANIISKNKKILQDSRLLERGWGNNEQDGKETNEEAKIRFKYFLTETILKYKNKKILLVTHGSLMKLAQDVIEGESITRDSIDNCTIIEYDKNKQKQIIKISIK